MSRGRARMEPGVAVASAGSTQLSRTDEARASAKENAGHMNASSAPAPTRHVLGHIEHGPPRPRLDQCRPSILQMWRLPLSLVLSSLDLGSSGRGSEILRAVHPQCSAHCGPALSPSRKASCQKERAGTPAASFLQSLIHYFHHFSYDPPRTPHSGCLI